MATDHIPAAGLTGRRRRAGLTALVVGLHAAVFAAVSLRTPAPPPAGPLIVEVALIPPPPAPPATEPAPETGGGAPAAPARLRPTEPPPRPVEPELPVPPAPAPEPALTVGIAPAADPSPGFGRGGEGEGRGEGTGAGDGPGAGVRTPPRNLRQPALRELRPFHPPEALRRNVSGLAVVSCRIRADTRLDDCRVLEEAPAGQGFGAAGVRVARELYRFRPAMVDGRPDDDVRAVIELAFGRDAPRPRGR
jgi:protein TonB